MPEEIPAPQTYDDWRPAMMTALDRFFFGLCFGMGFAIAANVLNFIGQFLHAAH